jgi:hypothetical protein
MYCPRCSIRLERDPLRCVVGDMPLSSELASRLVECFEDRVRPPVSKPLPFAVGGTWFCPACSARTVESSVGDIRCPRCRARLNEFIHALVELHPHRPLAPAAGMGFSFTDNHRRWSAAAARKHGGSVTYWLEMIGRQRARCAFSGAPLLFDAESGTSQKGGVGCHPLYAAVDHCDPGNDHLGHEIVSYDLNDLKGHLPVDCFADLRHTPAWGRLMGQWREQALLDPARESLRRIRRPGRIAG